MRRAPALSGRPRALAAALVPVAAGLAAALGQAPWEAWWLALPAFALGLWSVSRAAWPFLAGLAFGMAHFALALIWITEPFLIDAAVTGWIAPLALAGVSVGFGLFWAAAGWIGVRLLGGAPGVAVAMALGELLRSYLFTGFPWALPGHVLIGSPALPSAAWLGGQGMGVAILLGAGLLVSRAPWMRVAGAGLWAAPFAIGLSLPAAPPVPADAPVVRLVQPNASQDVKWDADWIRVFFDRGLTQTAAPPDGAAPVAVAWPETSLPELLDRSEVSRAMIADAAGGRPVMLGAQRYDAGGSPRNAAVLLDGPDGAVAAVHDKHRLVPFGEFLPLPRLFDLLGAGPIAQNLAGTFAAGDGPALIDLPGVGPVLPLICYEAIFPQDVRAVARPRAIVHLTNDAWFGTRVGPQQHLAITRLRAAESGLPILRAANTGVSAAIDARGRVLASLPLGRRGSPRRAPAAGARGHALRPDRGLGGARPARRAGGADGGGGGPAAESGCAGAPTPLATVRPPQRLPDGAGTLHRSAPCIARTTSSPRNPFPRAIPTRSATGSRTPCSTRS